MNITFADKSQVAPYVAAKWNAQDANEVKQAVNSKADRTSPDFLGTPTSTTPSPSDDSQRIATTAFVRAVLTALINGAPGVLDTLKELSDALNGDPNFSTTIMNQLALKAPLASPSFSGTPTSTTPSAGDNSTRIATTAYVAAALAELVNAAPSLLNTLSELSAAIANDPNFATTITNQLALKAPLASPVFSGTPTSTTPAGSDNSTRIATTAYVKALIAAISIPTVDTVVTNGGSNPVSGDAVFDHVTNAISALLGGAPAALDTLLELSAALGNDANFATTITNLLATKADNNKLTGLTSGLSISYDYDDGNIAVLPLAHNGTLGTIANAVNGNGGILIVKNTGNFSLEGIGGYAVRQGANAVTILSWIKESGIVHWTGEAIETKQIHATGAAVTMADSANWLMLDGTGTFAVVAVTMKPNPKEMEVVTITADDEVTDFSVVPNTGHSIKQATVPTKLLPGESVSYKYTNLKWYRIV